MFSRGRVCVLDKEGRELDKDKALVKIANPNHSQSQQDFLYQHLFFKGLGNNITRVIKTGKSNSIDSVIALENLIPSCIDYNELNKQDKFIYAPSDIKQLEKKVIKYNLDDTTFKIPISELMFFYDVSNGLTQDSRYKSPSRIDALIPALKNIEEAQSAKNINLRFSAKFIASGKKVDSQNLWSDTILGSQEKQEIENDLYHKDIHAIPNGLEVHALANDFSKLLYDASTSADLLKVCGAYSLNKDILNWALDGASTYENQNQSIVKWVENSIQFEADDWGNTLSAYFGYTAEGKKITMKYDHLPSIMKAMEEAKRNAREKMAKMLKTLVDAQMPYKDALMVSGIQELLDNGNSR